MQIDLIFEERRRFQNVIVNPYKEHNVDCVLTEAECHLYRLYLQEDRVYLYDQRVYPAGKYTDVEEPVPPERLVWDEPTDADAIRRAIAEFDAAVERAEYPHELAVEHSAYQAEYTPKKYVYPDRW